MRFAFVLFAAVLLTFSGSLFAAGSGPNGPAPYAGDGNSDGSGNDAPFGEQKGNGPAPNSGDGDPDGSGNDAPFGEQKGNGPAPNSGDGIPDGSGF